jgi:hypothetical protein
LSQLETEQHLFGVREIADDPPQRRRQLLDQRRRREDLVLLGQIGMLEDVDDLELIAAGQVGFA